MTVGLVVEMCGLPGSGKSVLAGLSATLLAERGVSCRIVDDEISAAASRGARAFRRLGRAGTEIGVRPRPALSAGRLILGSRQYSRRDAAAGFVQWLAIQRLISAGRRRAAVGIIEEGPVQTMWTLGLRAGVDIGPQLWRALSPSAHADLLCVVEAPLDVVLDRLERRESQHSRTQQLSASRRRAELIRGELLLERLVEEATLPLLRVCNDGADPHTVAAGIADAVVTLLGVENGAGDAGRA